MSFIALSDPLIFDVGFEDAAGNISSIYSEFVNWRNPYATDNEGNLLAAYCDDTEKLERFSLKIKENVDYSKDISFNIRVTSLLILPLLLIRDFNPFFLPSFLSK